MAAAFWSRYDLFGQGLGSFGGGDITVAARYDIVDLEAATPTTGYSVGARAATDAVAAAPAAEKWFRGGTLDISAGRNVIGGLFDAGGASASLTAGGSIAAAAKTGRGISTPATQLFYMDTDWTLQANGSILIGTPTNPAYFSGTAQGTNALKSLVVTGLDSGASISVLSTAGDVQLSPARPQLANGDLRASDVASRVMPDQVSLRAPGGSITADSLLQRPVGTVGLELLAQSDVSVKELQVNAAEATPTVAVVGRDAVANALDPNGGLWSQTSAGADQSDRSVVHLASTDGAVNVAGKLVSARPVRIVAETDVTLGGEMRVQHQTTQLTSDGTQRVGSELSSIEAGRDVRLGSNGSIRMAGPGDLMVVAGRDIDFGRGPGIVSVGNQDNTRVLPSGGANITLLAGVDLGSGDYVKAVAAGFQLRGGDRLAEHPDALAALLLVYKPAVDKDPAATPPDPASATQRAAAAAFRALTGEDQLKAAHTIVGDAAYLAAVGASMRARPGQSGLTDAQAVAAFDALGTNARASLLQPLTAGLLTTSLSALSKGFTTEQMQKLTAGITAGIAQARLIDFVEQQTGTTNLDAATASARYAALPVERQALLVNEVLFSELRAAGREAAQLAGEQREAAYAKGYAALAAVFPGMRTAGSITLSNSQTKTQQGGDIRILTPGGGVNVGDLGAAGSSRAASNLGIVTVAGGRVEAAVSGNFNVNQSRVFSLQTGDVLLWSSQGNLDAGRGAKTVTGSPPPLFSIDSNGNVVIDTSGSFSGSGIAVLDAESNLDLYAPKGEINAGDAGIKSAGNAFFGAVRFVGADNLSIGGIGTGAPPPAPLGGGTSGLSNLGQAATASVKGTDPNDDDEERRKRRARRNLLLEFLGFGPDKP